MLSRKSLTDAPNQFIVKNMKKYAVLIILVVLAIVVGITYLTQWLWNSCLVGAIDGVHPISTLQALGLYVLFAILIKTWNYNFNTKKD